MKIDTRSVQAAMDAQGLTRAELARRSGVSSGAVYGLFRQPEKDVRYTTVERLGKALAVSPQSLVRGGVRDVYLEWVEECHGSLDFRGLGLGQLRPIALNDLYVPTQVVAGVPDDDADHCDQRVDGLPRDRIVPRPAEQLEFEQAVRLNDRTLLLGGPGSGKTTLLRHLAAASAGAARGLSDPGEAVEVPLLVRLPDYARALEQEPSLDLVAFVAASVRQKKEVDPERVLRDELERGRCVVMVDALDEVPPGKRLEAVARSIRRFIRQYPSNRFVIAAREVGFDGRPWRRLKFAQRRVAPWGRDQVELFLDKWFAANIRDVQGRARAESQERAGGLFEAICSNPRIVAIAANPLMLVILAALHHGRGVLPRRRVDLCTKVADTLLESWESAKFSALPGDLLHGTLLEGREYGWLLARLALQMQRNDLTVAPGWWVTDHVRTFLEDELGFESDQANEECERVLRYITERSGLLVERGQGLYAFWHLAFQEYFASQAVVQEAASQPRRALTQALRDYLYRPRWSEVIRLVASQLTPSQAPALLRSILDDPDPVGRFLHRGPLLALRCLSDGAVVPDRQLLDQVFTSVVDLGKSRWHGITLDALCLLDEFRGTRLAALAEQTTQAILASARGHLSWTDRFLLHRFGDKELQERVSRLLAGNRQRQLGASVEIEFDGSTVEYYFFDLELRERDPETWYAQATELLRSSETDDAFQLELISDLEDAAVTTPRARETLTELLRDSPSERIREWCAWGLEEVAGSESVLAALLDVFGRDPSQAVRRACAASLWDVAPRDRQIRELLVRTFASEQPNLVREGAASGLRIVARTDESVRRLLVGSLLRGDEDESVRIRCCWSLARSLGRDVSASEAIVRLLEVEVPARLRRVASQVLAWALAAGRIAWDRSLVQRVEENLMQLPDPCAHALSALERLVDAREIRAGLRLERVLAESLDDAEASIDVAFVYGSVAQLNQDMDSDIDLFIVGDATLKQLSEPLSRAERSLGREINPVIYDRASLTERYHSGNPFVQDVLRREKIFIKGDENGVRDMVVAPATPGDPC